MLEGVRIAADGCSRTICQRAARALAEISGTAGQLKSSDAEPPPNHAAVVTYKQRARILSLQRGAEASRRDKCAVTQPSMRLSSKSRVMTSKMFSDFVKNIIQG